MPALAILACERGTPTASSAANDITVVAAGQDAVWWQAATAAFRATLPLDGLDPVRGHLDVESMTAATTPLLRVRLEATACQDARPLELELLVSDIDGGWTGDPSATGVALAAATGSAIRDTVATICADELTLANALVEERGPVLVARLREVGRRRATTLAPAVAAYLRSPDAGVRLAAAGALAQLGAREQVSDLIAAIDLRSPQDALALLPALARIGGPEARHFLQTVAEAAEEPALRYAAAELLPVTAPQ